MADEKNIGIDEEAVEVTEEVSETVETPEAAEASEETVSEVPKRPVSSNVKQNGDNEPHWYVVHTYSGYENKVKADIEKTIENITASIYSFQITDCR